jgi:hypothetical protein
MLCQLTFKAVNGSLKKFPQAAIASVCEKMIRMLPTANAVKIDRIGNKTASREFFLTAILSNRERSSFLGGFFSGISEVLLKGTSYMY